MGTITRRDGGWLVKLNLRDGSKKVRRVWGSYEDADRVAAALIEEYRGQLGYHFQGYPKLWRLHASKPRARSGVTPRVRFQVFQRDNFRCVYCGATPQQSQLHADHIVPVAKGGNDHPSNLATACAECNRGKSDLLLTEDGSNQ